MIAIDTNVVVRFLLNDDQEQARRARRLIETQDVFVATTVILEAEWVLRSVYKLKGGRMVEALRDFLTLPKVHAQDREATFQALDWAGRGMNFANALHLAGASACHAFASFDSGLKAKSAELGTLAVQAP